MARPSSCDVLILGAGAAGLAAAAELADAGRSVLVIEARDRIGGRIWTHREPGLPVPIELGAEFIHGTPPATFALLQKAGAAAVDAPRVHWIARRGRLQPMDDFFGELQAAMQKAHAPRRKDISFETFLARLKPGELSQSTRAFARMLVEGFDAADPARVSAAAIIEEWSGAGTADAPQFRPLGGYAALLAAQTGALASENVRLQLQSVVHTVRWKRGSVAVEGTFIGRSFRATARRAIITLPLGVLQLPPGAPGAVRFEPGLQEKRKALQGLAPGPVLKVALKFRQAFWEELDEQRYREVSFFHSPATPFPTFWTTLPFRVPLLLAWAGGPKAARLAGADTYEIVRQALASLESIFGKRGIEAELEAAWVHDWQRDPFARGAYSYVTVGGAGARQALAAPVQKTLWLAGEASDTEGEAGTVAGALQSGQRAAREAIR